MDEKTNLMLEEVRKTVLNGLLPSTLLGHLSSKSSLRDAIADSAAVQDALRRGDPPQNVREFLRSLARSNAPTGLLPASPPQSLRKITPVPIPHFGPPPKAVTSRPSLDASSSSTSAGTSQSESGAMDDSPKPGDVGKGAAKIFLKMKRTGTSQSPFGTPSHSSQQIPDTKRDSPAHQPDQPLALVMSDIVPTPDYTPSTRSTSSTPSHPGHLPTEREDASSMVPVSTTKGSTPAHELERRKALSQAMKARWSSGLMDHVHAKQTETIRKRKEEESEKATGSAKKNQSSNLAGEASNLPANRVSSRLGRASSLTGPLDLGSAGLSSVGPGSRKRPASASSDSGDIVLLGARDISEENGFRANAADEKQGSESDSDSVSGWTTDSDLAEGSPPEVAPIVSGDWKPLWQYIQPFLVRHKGPAPPKNGHVKELVVLPRVRDLRWNDSWVASHPFLDSLPRDVSSLVIQLTGEPAPAPCSRCAEGKGPFDTCVMMSRRAHDNPLRNVFACAGCFYHFGQSNCTHRSWGAHRAAKIMEVREGRATMQSIAGVLAGETSDNENLQSLVGSAPAGLVQEDQEEDDEHQRRNEQDSLPVETKSETVFLLAEPGRLYKAWPDEAGNLVSTSGALLPKGYELDFTIPGRRWICPVRTCRTVFAKVSDLGYHFERTHYGQYMNDNCDGTLSVTSIYKEKTGGVGRGGKILEQGAPLIVSRSPVDAAAHPIPKAQLPGYLQASAATDLPQERLGQEGPRYPTRRRSSIRNSPLPTMSPTPTAPNLQNPESDPRGLWTYMKQHSSLAEVAENSYVEKLLELPWLRILSLKEPRSRFQAESLDQLAALAIQLTGESLGSCQQCLDGHGPFKGCYVIAQEADLYSRLAYTYCANCTHEDAKCSIRDTVLMREPMPDHLAQSYARSGRFASQMATIPKAPDRRKRRRILRDDTPSPSSEPPKQVNQTNGVHGLSSSAANVGQPVSGDILEMEDWEMAPGIIRQSYGLPLQSIAFSKAYLSANQAVPVSDNISFRVDTIRSGTTFRIEPDPIKLRVCSIATGKLIVRVGEEPEFTIGPHGIFKVEHGVACTITNRLYVDGILHTSVLPGFM